MSHDKLVFKVKDKDLIGGDDLVCSINLRIKDLVKDYSSEKGGFLWKRLYGAPRKANSKAE